MHEWNQWYIYQTFHDQDTMIAMKGRTTRVARMFLYSIHRGLAHASTPGTLADGSTQSSRRKMGFLRMPNFYLKKENYYLKSWCEHSCPVPNFDTVRKRPYSVYMCELWNFPICFRRPRRKHSTLRTVIF